MEAKTKSKVITWLIGIGAFLTGAAAGVGGTLIYNKVKGKETCCETETETETPAEDQE